jgi:hypothetical protein
VQVEAGGLGPARPAKALVAPDGLDGAGVHEPEQAGRDPVPGVTQGAGAEPARFPPEGDEGVLDHLGGAVVIGDDAGGEGVGELAVADVELVKGATVPLGDEGAELPVPQVPVRSGSSHRQRPSRACLVRRPVRAWLARRSTASDETFGSVSGGRTNVLNRLEIDGNTRPDRRQRLGRHGLGLDLSWTSGRADSTGSAQIRLSL